DTSFSFSPTTYQTRLDYLGVNWYETFSKHFHAGLEVGYINMSQINNTISSAQFTSGEYAGMLLKYIPVNTSTFSLAFNLNHRINQTQGTSTDQITLFDWSEALLFAQFEYSPVDNLSLSLTAEHQQINGEQQNSGTDTNVSAFKESKQQGYRFGINFITQHTGTVGIEWFSGFRSGVALNFSRRF
ncbi:MAG: hypothetical protein KAU21_06875, partial [Gammaproteobacteria bacterium]|nr:hypothetical protein [Gammaproteobacteria bacterium]